MKTGAKSPGHKEEKDNMFKKLLALVVVAVMVLSLAACGTKKDTTDTDKSAADTVGKEETGTDTASDDAAAEEK